MKQSAIQLTKRDIEIIRFINECGFCEMPQIERRFGLKKPRSYRIIRRLISAELVTHRRIFHSTYGIYHLTADGAECTDLPPLGKISIGRYEHQLKLTNVYIRLLEKYPESNWISERRLKHEKFYTGVGKSGHLSDGILILQNEKQIAIEVELNLKGKNRIDSILKGYAAQFSFSEIWYFCPQGMVAALKSLATKMTFIKIHNITEFLA